MSWFQRALQKRSEELGVRPPELEVQKLKDTYPSWGDHVLYFMVYRGQLVYVGMTRNLQKRVSQHRCHKAYQKLRERTAVYYSVLSCSYEELREVEASFIQLLQPKLNLKS